MNSSAFRIPLLALLLAGCVSPTTAQSKGPGRYVETIESEGVTRSYILRIPKKAEEGKPLPIVLILHGWTGTAKLAEVYTDTAEEAEKRGYIAVYPDGLGERPGWNAGFIDLSGQKKDDVAFMKAILDKVESELKVDKNRVFMCGHSNGAFMSHFAATQIGDRLAAIGAVAGTTGVGPRIIPDAKVPVSVLMIHAKNDNTVAYDENSQSLLKGISQSKSAQWWAKQLGIATSAEKVEANDGKVVTETWKNGKNGRMVQLVTLADGGHAWPGGRTVGGKETASGIRASILLFDFFDANPKK